MNTRYGILLPGNVLAHDLIADRPQTYAHRRSAARAILRSLPPFLRDVSRVVKVRVYSEVEDMCDNGLTTYEVQS